MMNGDRQDIGACRTMTAPASDDSPEPVGRPAAERLDAAPAPDRARFGASSSLMSEPSAGHAACLSKALFG